uniref:hypothetical protein n=1 Tax=Paracoccus sp. TRP TaxID=412597 RepID=UPI000225F998|nr:hypothetical protein [Paracoccus sp. TRP]
MYLPPLIHDALIDSAETEGYVPGAIETVMRFDLHSRWCAGVIAECCVTRSRAIATRCVLLLPPRGRRIRKLALHPVLPADVVKSMLGAH